MPAIYADSLHEGGRKKAGITTNESKAWKGTIAADIDRYLYGTNMHIPGNEGGPRYRKCH